MHTVRGRRDMLPIYSSGTPGAKYNDRKYQDTPKPEAYTRRGIAGSTSSPWLPRKGQRDLQHRRHHGEMASAKPSRRGHFLISSWKGNRRGDIHLLQDNVSNWRLTTILRSRISMRPARWNSLISLETASLVEKIMFARSWCVRRTFKTVPEPSDSPKRSPRCESNVARRADTSLYKRLSIVSSDCLRRSEKEENSFRAKSGRRFITSLRTDFRTTATRASVTASAKAFWQYVSSRLSSPKTSPSLNSATVASL